MTVSTWKEIALAKKERVKDSIPSKWIKDSIKDDMIKAGFANTNDYLNTIVADDELAITQLTMLELRDKIAAGELKSLEVAEAYCHRAALAAQILNCCSEIFFDVALKRAQLLDDHFAKHGKVVGPLHGVPISLKDQVDLVGLDSAIGYVAYIDKPKTRDSVLAEFLFNSGAVFYVKTTVPMAMMSPETESNIYGYTFNACNIKLACGGSSGGEGALIGAGASPLGLGTDIGGSIRVPSAFQGLHALRPSTDRFAYLRVTNSYASQEIMPSVIGPMGRSLADVEYVTKLVFDAGLWEKDPKVPAIPYVDASEVKAKKLVFGIWRFDQKVMPHPPILRGLDETAKALKAKGHEVIEIDFPCHDKIMETAIEIYTADNGADVKRVCKLSGEPPVPSVLDNITSPDKSVGLSLKEWWQLCTKLYECKQEYYDMWNNTSSLTSSGSPIDAIICPIWPSTSFLPAKPPTLNYSCPFNAVDSPCVVLPVTKVDKTIDTIDASYVPVDETDKWVHESYDPELFDGMPVCLQVVGKKFQDEKMLAVASVVESCLEK